MIGDQLISVDGHSVPFVDSSTDDIWQHAGLHVVLIRRGSQLLHNRWTMMSMTEFVAKAAAMQLGTHVGKVESE